MSRGKFLKEWQVTDKIIEWIFFQLTFSLLQMTQTQKIITHRVLKIQEWIWQGVYDWGKFLKEWQVREKIIELFFFTIHILHFMNDSNSRNNNW